MARIVVRGVQASPPWSAAGLAAAAPRCSARASLAGQQLALEIATAAAGRERIEAGSGVARRRRDRW